MEREVSYVRGTSTVIDYGISAGAGADSIIGTLRSNDVTATRTSLKK